MANAQPVEIRHQRRCVVQGKTTVELQPGGGGQRLHTTGDPMLARRAATSGRSSNAPAGPA